MEISPGLPGGFDGFSDGHLLYSWKAILTLFVSLQENMKPDPNFAKYYQNSLFAPSVLKQ